MANEYAIFSTPWTTVLENGETINTPKLPQDYSVPKWQDVTGNYNGVSPNQYQIEVWADTATMDAIEADSEYTMSPGSWVDLDNPPPPPEEP